MCLVVDEPFLSQCPSKKGPYRSSSNVRKSELREIFACKIWNPGLWNPEAKLHWQGIHNPEPGIIIIKNNFLRIGGMMINQILKSLFSGKSKGLSRVDIAAIGISVGITLFLSLAIGFFLWRGTRNKNLAKRRERIRTISENSAQVGWCYIYWRKGVG